MCLRSLQRLLQDSSGRFAPFMFGLLLAVSALSMTMKTRVESKLAEQKHEEEARAKSAAADLSQAMEVSMLLETSYDSTFTANRARQYLSRSSGMTAGDVAPTFDIQTGTTTLDGLARQTALVGVTDDTLINTAITAGNTPTTFDSTGAMPTAVVDSLGVRQNQLAFSKQRLDAFSGDVLDFARSKYRMPTTTELTDIATATGASTAWGGAFTNVETNIFSQINRFAAPWSGADTFGNTVTLPYTSTGVPYTWSGAAVSNVTHSTATSSASVVAATDGTIAVDVPFGVGTGVTSYTYIYEYGSSWTEKQRLQRVGPANNSIAIANNTLAVTSVDANAIDIYRRTSGNWYKTQTITDTNASGNGNYFNSFGAQMVLKAYVDPNGTTANDRTYLYVADRDASNQYIFMYRASVAAPTFSLVATFTLDAACNSGTKSMSVDVPTTLYTISALAVPDPILAIGCGAYNGFRGRVWLHRSTTTTAFQTLSPTTLNATDQFGNSVSLKWPYLAVGSPFDEVTVNDQGATYVFHDANNFTPTPNFVSMAIFQGPVTTPPAGCGSNVLFGSAVSFIDERSLAIFAPCTTAGPNSSWYIYTLGNAGWALVRTITNATNVMSQIFSGVGGVFAFGGSTSSGPDLYAYKASEL